MDIYFYKIKNNAVLNSQSVELSDELFLKLSKSEFSQIGASKKIKVKIDEDEIELGLVELSSKLRSFFLIFLKDLLVEVLSDSFDKLGESPSKDEFFDYTCDPKSILNLIECFQNQEFTHLNRIVLRFS